MNEAPQDFTARVKTALLGSPVAPLVFLGNFEVEAQWARGERALPRVTTAAANAVVNRMDEFALLLAGECDHVLLKSEPDPDYLDHLRGLGLSLPRLHVVADQDSQRTITEDVLEDAALLDTLSRLGTAEQRPHLAPHGISTLEERLAARTGLPLAGPSAAICKAVNSKVYSRRVADELGLRQPKGWSCETTGELPAAVAAAGDLLAAGRKVVVKEAFGVSGKGITVVDSERRLARLAKMIKGAAERAGDDRVAFVIEEWVAKKADLNYQFTVGADGSVHFDFVKEAITEGGVHKGHRMPARLPAGQVAELADVAESLGKRLAADGYLGVAGVDAMLDPDGDLYPVVEINARNNMSTYQVRLQERFVGPDRQAMARYYPVRVAGGGLSFGEVHRALDELLLDRPGDTGLLVNNFATVNAAAGTASVDGRLYGLVVADSDQELATLDRDIASRLAAMEDSGHGC